jgi:hypothetical protein
MILFLKYLTFFKKSNCHPSNFLITIDPTKRSTRKVRKKKLFSPYPNMWSGDQGKFGQFLILLELKKDMTQFHSCRETAEYFSSLDPSFVMAQPLTSLLSHLYKFPLVTSQKAGTLSTDGQRGSSLSHNPGRANLFFNSWRHIQFRFTHAVSFSPGVAPAACCKELMHS